MTIAKLQFLISKRACSNRGRRMAVMAAILAASCGMPTASALCQEVRHAIRDYFSGPITYSPFDPETRSKVFQAHTGHSGLFYNCDGEECKRNSPYICWKTNSDSLIPPRRGLWRGAKLDLAEVRQRIYDGAGEGCRPNCECRECMAAHQIPGGYLAEQAASDEDRRAESASNNESVLPTPIPATAPKRFGLVSGANSTSTPQSVVKPKRAQLNTNNDVRTSKTVQSNSIRR